MSHTAQAVLFLLAFVCFVFAAVGVKLGSVNLTAAGLAVCAAVWGWVQFGASS